MRIVDCQLHEPRVLLEWEGAEDSVRSELMVELQLDLMDAVGVHRALLFPIDADWGIHAASRFPDRFAVVPMVTAGGAFNGMNAEAPDIDDWVAELRRTPGVVALRIVRTSPAPDGSPVLVPAETFDPAVAACARHGLPIFMSTVADLSTPARLAQRHPELTVIVDHLGLAQPPSYRPEEPRFRSLPELLKLAEEPNIAIKCSGVPTMSRDAYPFPDLWPPLRQVIDAFGPERLMWGSDFSRVLGRAGFAFRIGRGEGPYEGKHTYAEALLYMRETDELSRTEKEAILGGTAERILNWP